MYGLEHGGIGRYVKNLLDNLPFHDQQYYWTLFLPKKYHHSLNFPSRVSKVMVDIPHYSLKEQVALTRIFAKENLDLLHIPHFNVPINYPKPFVVTIHDLLWHSVKGLSVTTLNPLQYLIKYSAYRLVVRQAVKRARAIIVPSNFVKREIKKYNLSREQKITTIYESVDTNIHASKDQPPLKKWAITDPFIVYVGSLYPHKNVERLISSMKLIQPTHPNLKLVIASARSVFLDRLKHKLKDLEVTDAVISTGFVTDEELAILYHHAQALVHPSLSEGFGLTGLEAMAHNTPVIAARAGALPEIYQDAALYVDPLDPSDIAQKIVVILKDQPLRQKLIAAGNFRAKSFSWKKSVQETLAVYQQSL